MKKELLGEKRFVYKGGKPKGGLGEAPETAGKSPSGYAKEFLGIINNIVDPAKIEQAYLTNPYREALDDHVKDFTDDDLDFAWEPKVTAHEITIKTLKGVEYPIPADTDYYKALVWPKTLENLLKIFEGQTLDTILIHIALVKGSENLIQILDRAALGEDKVDEALKRDALAEMEALKPLLKARPDRDLTKLDAKARRVALRKVEALPVTAAKAPTPAPEKPTMDLKTFSEESIKNTTRLDELKIIGRREGDKIDSTKWDHTNLASIDIAEQEMTALGIFESPSSRDYYRTVLDILRNAAIGSDNPYLSENNGQYAKYFRDPIRYKKELNNFPKKGKFWGGAEFFRAFDAFKDLKAKVSVMASEQDYTLDKQRGMDGNEAVDKVMSFAKDNLNKFRKAIKERDYSTAATYALGGYLLYKAYQKLFAADGPMGKFNTAFLYLGAAYAGNIFLKNAGYDVLKMAGFKNENYEVEGTPMEVMRNILRKDKLAREEVADIDYRVVLRVADIRLTDLQENYEKAHGEGLSFIDPGAPPFDEIFGQEISSLTPYDIGAAKEDLSETSGASDIKLNSAQREYRRLGRQLYKIAKGMKIVYNETLINDHPEYKNLSYEDMLRKSHGKMAKVRHLFSAISSYGAPNPDKMSRHGRDKATLELTSAFENVPDSKFHLSGNELGPMQYEGRIMNYPVVFVYDTEGGDGYKVYLRNQWQGVEAPGAGFMSKIPLTDDEAVREIAAKKATEGVKVRMVEMLQKLDNIGGKQIWDPTKTKGANLEQLMTAVNFDGTNWKTKIKLPGAVKKGVQGGEEEATITPSLDGTILYLETKSGVKINVDENAEKQNPLSLALLPKLVSQREFKALAVFSDAGRLRIDYTDPNDEKLDLIIGNRNLKVQLKFVPDPTPAGAKPDPTKGKYEFVSPTAEAELLKPGSGFSEELKEVLGESQKLKEITEDWTKLVRNTPEKYFTHLLTSIPNWWNQATWDEWFRGFRAKDLTGSVPKNYTLGLIEAQKNFILYSLGNKISGATKLSDVSAAVSDDFNPAVRDLDYLMHEYSNLRTAQDGAGEKFSEEEFKSKVLTPLMETGVKSTDYKDWYKKFADRMFLLTGGDDFRKTGSLKAKALVDVFTFYTSVVDDEGHDGASLSMKLTPQDITDFENLDKAVKALKAAGKTVDATNIVAQLAAAPISVTKTKPEVEDLLKLSTKVEKLKLHLLHRKYVNYVEGQISLKINQALLDGEIPPPAAADWGIEKFDTWKDRPTVHTDIAHELVDSREVLSTSQDYIPLDRFLAKYQNLPTPPPANVIAEMEKVILPTNTINFTVTAGWQQDLVDKLLGMTMDDALLKTAEIDHGKDKDKNIDDMHAKIEKNKLLNEFSSKLNEELDRIGRDHEPTTEFLELRRRYKFRYSLKQTAAVTGVSQAYEFGILKDPNNDDLFDAVDRIESQMRTTKSLTRTDQENIINREVSRIINHDILHIEVYYKYFKKWNLLEAGKNMTLNLWDRVTGFFVGNRTP